MLKENYSIQYILKKPKKIYKNNLSPLFLMIHGYGSNEKNIFFFEKNIPDNFFIISIRGIHSMDEKDKYYWYDIDFLNNKKMININQAKKSIEKINSFINDSIKKYFLDKNQVWLFGFSQGAILSYAIALNNSKIKKVLAISGYLEERFLLKNIDKLKKDRFKNLDIFISHGKYDTIIPIDWTKKGLDILKNKKVSLFYKEYNSGHTINDCNYKDIINWINKNNIIK